MIVQLPYHCAAEVLDTFSKDRRGTEEDRKYDLVLKDGDRYKLSKTPMARHLLRHHFNPFYFAPTGAFISYRFKEAVRIDLGVQSLAPLSRSKTS